MGKIKQNFLRVMLADSTAVEFAAGIYALSTLPKVWGVPVQDRLTSAAVVLVALLRLHAVLMGNLGLRLTAAYAATFVWIYFIMFSWLEAPAVAITGGIASALINVWIAWRLQTESHLRKKAVTIKREEMIE